MRFERKRRWGEFAWTPRKLAAAQSHGERVRARQEKRYPLLADQLPQPAPFDADAEARMRSEAHQQTEQRFRDFEARVWRESRRDARAAPAPQQAAIREHWLSWSGPATALYFRYVVDLHTGVLEQRQQAAKERSQALVAAVLAGQRAQGHLFQDTEQVT